MNKTILHAPSDNLAGSMVNYFLTYTFKFQIQTCLVAVMFNVTGIIFHGRWIEHVVTVSDIRREPY